MADSRWITRKGTCTLWVIWPASELETSASIWAPLSSNTILVVYFTCTQKALTKTALMLSNLITSLIHHCTSLSSLSSLPTCLIPWLAQVPKCHQDCLCSLPACLRRSICGNVVFLLQPSLRTVLPRWKFRKESADTMAHSFSSAFHCTMVRGKRKQLRSILCYCFSIVLTQVAQHFTQN